MKYYYKISEISKLYSIGQDSLRYYERLGILNPKRDKNQYRMYSLKDIYKLNLIRDLRNLNFSMAQIKDYLDHQTVENTLNILCREDEFLKIQIQELIERQAAIKERIASLSHARNLPSGHITVKALPCRRCVQETAYMTQDEEMDLHIQKLLARHGEKVHNFGSQAIGAFLSAKDLLGGTAHVYRSVFFILESDSPNYDCELPAGDYLSYCYRGSYENNARCLMKMAGHMSAHGLTALGEPFELFKIDNRDTVAEDEFLTEIQILIESV